MNYRLYIITFVFCCFITPLRAYDLQKQLYSQIFSAPLLASKPEKRINHFADLFLNKPYRANTLENDGEEKLTIKLDVFDCVTYVETITALTLVSFSPNKSFSDFNDTIRKLRYRDGIINGYGSRLHYFSEWSIQNSSTGVLTDITKQLGGVPIKRNVSLMSSKPDLYPGIISNTILKQIKISEANLSEHTFYYLPKKNVRNMTGPLPDGSIIAIVTSNQRIFISHTGFARTINNTTHLQHASQRRKKVVISREPLYKYLDNSKTSIGIMVLTINRAD
ncbi:MAG: DUF1460 domain-containing protein [Spirochaetes bacterium]|jgi:hypothetical protein|nr:DUF1460 domain-containing protein [Spirochaetota bacterium]